MPTASLIRSWIGKKQYLAARVVPIAERHLKATGGKLVSLFYGTGALEQMIGTYDSPQIVAEGVPELRTLYRELAKENGVAEIRAALEKLDAGRVAAVGLVAGRSRAELDDAAKAYFNRIRGLDVSAWPAAMVAARFLFLASTSFNGMWRVNADGGLNMPPDPARVWNWPTPGGAAFKSAALNAQRLTVLDDWTEAASAATDGDLLLADSPYFKTFDGYTAGGFPPAQHLALASFLNDTSCGVIAFNSLAARGAYSTAAPRLTIEIVSRSGRVSSKAEGRGDVGELMMTANLKGQQ